MDKVMFFLNGELVDENSDKFSYEWREKLRSCGILKWCEDFSKQYRSIIVETFYNYESRRIYKVIIYVNNNLVFRWSSAFSMMSLKTFFANFLKQYFCKSA